MSSFDALVKKVSQGTLDQAKDFVTEDAWNLITEEGRAELVVCADLFAECILREAAGEDCSVAKAALSAAIGNWELSGKIRAAGHADDFLQELKAGLIEGAEIALKLLVTAVKVAL